MSPSSSEPRDGPDPDDRHGAHGAASGRAGNVPGAAADPVQLGGRRALRILLRGLLRRCPNCGSGGLFSRWVVMRRSCPRCHLILDRGEPDYFIGGYVVNFVTAELLIAAGGLAAILLTWPDVPWDTIKWSLLLLMIPVPILFYPFAKTLWLAVDLVFRPPTLHDLEGHGENVADVPPEAETERRRSRS